MAIAPFLERMIKDAKKIHFRGTGRDSGKGTRPARPDRRHRRGDAMELAGDGGTLQTAPGAAHGMSDHPQARSGVTSQARYLLGEAVIGLRDFPRVWSVSSTAAWKLGRTLVAHRDVDHVTFTGSSKGGRGDRCRVRERLRRVHPRVGRQVGRDRSARRPT